MGLFLIKLTEFLELFFYYIGSNNLKKRFPEFIEKLKVAWKPMSCGPNATVVSMQIDWWRIGSSSVCLDINIWLSGTCAIGKEVYTPYGDFCCWIYCNIRITFYKQCIERPNCAVRSDCISGGRFWLLLTQIRKEFGWLQFVYEVAVTPRTTKVGSQHTNVLEQREEVISSVEDS